MPLFGHPYFVAGKLHGLRAKTKRAASLDAADSPLLCEQALLSQHDQLLGGGEVACLSTLLGVNGEAIEVDTCGYVVAG